jgi:hypothetical protein
MPSSNLSSGFRYRIDSRIAALDLTNKQVADEAGVAESTIRKWRHGLSAPKVSDLPGLADALGATVHWLVCGDSEETPDSSGVKESPLVAVAVGVIREALSAYLAGKVEREDVLFELNAAMDALAWYRDKSLTKLGGGDA